MKSRLLPSAILLLHGGGGLVTVVHASARPSRARAALLPRRPSPSAAAAASTHRNSIFIPILHALNVRGGGNGINDEGGTEDTPRRRRRRKKARTDTDPSTDPVDASPSLESKLVASAGDGEAISSAKTGRKRRRLSRMFGKSNNSHDGSNGDVPSSDSALQAENGDAMDAKGTVASDTDGSSGEVSSAGTRKRRRRRPSGDRAHSSEGGSLDTALYAAPSETSPIDDAPSARVKKRRKRRRTMQKGDRDAPVGQQGEEASEAEASDAFPSEPIDFQSDLQGDQANFDSTSRDGSCVKKKRRRKKRNVGSGDIEKAELPSTAMDAEEPAVSMASIAADASIEMPSEEDVPGSIVGDEEKAQMTSESIDSPEKKRRRRRKTKEAATAPAELHTDNAESLSTSIAIDAKVDIPSEEVVPESIGAVVEVQDNLPIDPINDERVDEPPASDAGEEAGEEAPTEAIAEEAAGLSNSITIDASVEIPSEVIVPESIDAAVEVGEDLPIEPLDDKVADASLDVLVHVSDDEQEMEPHVVEREAMQGMEDANFEINSAVGAEEDAAGPENDVSTSPELIEDETTDQKDGEPLSGANTADAFQITLPIDASIELPSEEIAPESIGASVEVEEKLHDIEPMEASLAEADAGNFDMTMSNEDVSEDSVAVVAEDLDSDSAGDSAEVSSEMVTEANEAEIDGTIDDMSNMGDVESPSEEQIELENASEEEAGDEEEDLDADGAEDDNDAEKTHVAPEDDVREVAEDGAEEEEEDATAKEELPTNVQVEDGSVVGDNVSIDNALPTPGTASEVEDIDQTTNELELQKMDDDCLKLSMVTWNLGEAAPSEKEASFLRKLRKNDDGVGSDLVMIGAQECEEIKPRRTEGHRSRHLRRMGILMLGKEYVPLAIHSLGGIQCALYCHRDVLGDVEMINIADVTCGVGNVLHNKGAIGVYLKMKRRDDNENGFTKSSRMLFVTGHLAAHVKNVDARNDDFKRIISELEAQAPARFLRPKRNPDGTPAKCDGSHLLSSMDHVFFAGDLNYRIDLPREYVERCIVDIERCLNEEKANTYDTNMDVDALMKKLLRRDQLLQTIASGRAFSQFNEGRIAFLPTFKFDKGTSNYDTSHKQRVPAWTDRILFRSNKVRVLEYQSAVDARHSDHRPVYGTYEVGWGRTENGKPVGSAKAKNPRRSRSRKKRD